MRRITADEVKAAYESTGLKPAGGRYVGENGDCACGLGVLFVAAVGTGALDMAEERIEARIPGVLGINATGSYMDGFIKGFDGEAAARGYAGAGYLEGYKDGRAARVAVGL